MMMGNRYCKFCGDIIDPKEEMKEFPNICGNCFVEKLEEGTAGK